MPQPRIQQLSVRITINGDKWEYKGAALVPVEGVVQWTKVFQAEGACAPPPDADQVGQTWSLLCSMMASLHAWARVNGRRL